MRYTAFKSIISEDPHHCVRRETGNIANSIEHRAHGRLDRGQPTTIQTPALTAQSDDSISNARRRTAGKQRDAAGGTIINGCKKHQKLRKQKHTHAHTHAHTHTHTHMHAQHKHAPTINQILSFSLSRTHTHHTTTYLIRINDSTLKIYTLHHAGSSKFLRR